MTAFQATELGTGILLSNVVASSSLRRLAKVEMTVTQATWSGEDPILTILEKRDSASWYLPARWYPEMMLVQHTASGQAIPPNTMRASPTRAHLAYMFTSAAAQNAPEEKPVFTASQCTYVPEARAPSLAHADRTAARSNWSGRP
jgi:hypothetical protein